MRHMAAGEEIWNPADVIDVGVGDENFLEWRRGDRIECDAAGERLEAGVEEDHGIVRPNQPDVHAFLAEGKIDPVDFWDREWLRREIWVMGEGFWIKVEGVGELAGGFGGKVAV